MMPPCESPSDPPRCRSRRTTRRARPRARRLAARAAATAACLAATTGRPCPATRGPRRLRRSGQLRRRAVPQRSLTGISGRPRTSGSCFDSPSRPYFDRPVRDVVRDHDAIVIGGGDLLVPWGLGDRYWLPDYLRRPVHVVWRRGAHVASTAKTGRGRGAVATSCATGTSARSRPADEEERGLDPRAPASAGRGRIVGGPRVRACRCPRSNGRTTRRSWASSCAGCEGGDRLHRGPRPGGARARARVSAAHDRALDRRGAGARRASARRAGAG